MIFGCFRPALDAPLIFSLFVWRQSAAPKGENLLPTRPIERLKKGGSTASLMHAPEARSHR
jgi:hypothetical protein